jgi:hypothetical protein
MMMNNQEILGMYSADAAAKEMPYGSNMTISAALVIEMVERIVALEKERIKLLSCLLDISDECIGEITMNYKVDSEYIGGRIHASTGMTNPQLWEALKEKT